MKPNDKLEAFRHLHGASVPDEAALEAMSAADIDAFLASEGVDLSKLRQRLAEKKKRFAGQYALMLARQRRLARPDTLAPGIAVPPTREAILKFLKQKYGEELPLAARNCQDMNYEEMSQLFLDLEGEDLSRPDGQ